MVEERQGFVMQQPKWIKISMVQRYSSLKTKDQRPKTKYHEKTYLSEIISQSPQQNDTHEAAQKDHHHEAVEDTEPMYFMLEEVILQISVKTIHKLSLCFFPMNAICELHNDKYRYVCLRVDISMMVMGDDSDVTVYDRRRSELSNTPLHIA